MHVLHKIALAHPHLTIAVVVGTAVGLILPADVNLVARVLIGWNCTVWLYLFSMAWLMLRASHARVRKIAEQEDKGSAVILAIMSVAAIVSILAIILELSNLKGLTFGDRFAHYAYTGLTVFGSWFLVATLFTFHYARMYYKSPGTHRALKFPDAAENLDYWDFLYFSFTIAVAVQTSDVAVMSHSMRKAVLAQSILSFFFNAAILGLSINIAASLLGA